MIEKKLMTLRLKLFTFYYLCIIQTRKQVADKLLGLFLKSLKA